MCIRDRPITFDPAALLGISDGAEAFTVRDATLADAILGWSSRMSSRRRPQHPSGVLPARPSQ
eukprot:3000883-Pyramimonas_sp.AAC.1